MAVQATFAREISAEVEGVVTGLKPDEVVFAEPGDATLLGVRTLEGFGVTVDYMAHRFVATTTIVASFEPIS